MSSSERALPPGSFVSPKSTMLECANVSTSATYVASVPVGNVVLFGVVVLSDGKPRGAPGCRRVLTDHRRVAAQRDQDVHAGIASDGS